MNERQSSRRAAAKCWGSAHGSRAVFGHSPKTYSTKQKFAKASRLRPHASRVRSPAMAAALVLTLTCANAQDAASPQLTVPAGAEAEEEAVVVTATRLEIPKEESPAAITLLESEELEKKQVRRVADALREVPGLSVVQTGTPGQLTSLFTRGLRSQHTQVLLDGIPLNQGLGGLFNFADLTLDNIDRIEVVRGPQSTLYGPRALAGAIQLFTKEGERKPLTIITVEGGSFSTFRESVQTEGAAGDFNYAMGASRFDSDFERRNNQYRSTSGLASFGWSPDPSLRVRLLAAYSLADAGNPNTISSPRPLDNLLTERWLLSPQVEFKPVDWWRHRFLFSYDHERQLNDPNEDGFIGATRALFRRVTIDYQNDLSPASWLTLTSGYFFNRNIAGQERPFILFGDTFISDLTVQHGVFAQATVTPWKDLTLVAGGRFDHFNQFGGVRTYRFAGNYVLPPTGTSLHGSIATGFSPPTSQDKIFGNNFALEPEEGRGWDIGVRQSFWGNRVSFDVTFFHNRLTNLIGFNGLFETLNLGAARTRGVEFAAEVTPMEHLSLRATYTYLEAENTSDFDITQPEGQRLPRRPRHEAYVSASYLWFGRLRTIAEAKFVAAREELSFGAPNFDIEDYAVVNIAAEYEFDPMFSIFGRIENITDEEYAEVFGFPALNRGFYGGVKVRF